MKATIAEPQERDITSDGYLSKRAPEVVCERCSESFLFRALN